MRALYENQKLPIAISAFPASGVAAKAGDAFCTEIRYNICPGPGRLNSGGQGKTQGSIIVEERKNDADGQ